MAYAKQAEEAEDDFKDEDVVAAAETSEGIGCGCEGGD